MGGGGQTQQAQNQVATTQLPPWVSNAAQQNYAEAQQVAARPLQQYQGQMVADVGPQSQQAWNLAAGPSPSADSFQAAGRGFNGIMAATPDLQPYMNPYTNSVINATLPILQQQTGQSQIAAQNNATSANAFGGSRLGVQQGVAQAQGALNEAQMAAQLNQANFGQAQSAWLQNQGLKLNAAQGSTALGQAQNQGQLQQFEELSSSGQAEQQQAQNVINANMAKFAQANNYPVTQMNTLLAGLGMTPYGQSQTTSGTQTTQQSTDPMQAALGVATVLGGLIPVSDREDKTDIKKIGKVGNLPMYSYRYKGDPKSYPKVIGPMAQDIQKLSPSDVVTIAGHKAISPGMGILANRAAGRPSMAGMGALSRG